MKRWLKIFLVLLLAVFLLAVGGTIWYANKALPIGTGFVAKYLCSSTFISKRDPQRVFKEDVAPVNPLAKVVKWKIDRNEKSATATAFGMFTSKAVYREGCGCTLVGDGSEASLRAQTFFKRTVSPEVATGKDTLPWPQGKQGSVDPASLGIDPEKLRKALDSAFDEPVPEHTRKTRAVVVVYDGKLVAERYASGFDARMPLLGWSMNKSITNALMGIMVKKRMLNIHQPAPVPEWHKTGDPRQSITLDQLLRMSSGLAFEEVYAPMHDAADMLYGSDDFAAFAAQKPLDAKPDSRWSYSSGTTNIIARTIRATIEAQEDRNYYDFIYKELFARIGMTSTVLEADASGTFVGSSYAFATPRDWARFGLLYMQDGVWNGERILPEGWVAYTTMPTAKAPKGEYGAHFWLNAGAAGSPEDRPWPDAPRDTFAAKGFQGQRMVVIPSRKLVLVRFGASTGKAAWQTNSLIRDVLTALPK